VPEIQRLGAVVVVIVW